MALVTSSQPNKTLKLFSLKLYKIRVRLLDFLVQNLRSFTTPIYCIVKHPHRIFNKALLDLTATFEGRFPFHILVDNFHGTAGVERTLARHELQLLVMEKTS